MDHSRGLKLSIGVGDRLIHLFIYRQEAAGNSHRKVRWFGSQLPGSMISIKASFQNLGKII